MEEVNTLHTLGGAGEMGYLRRGKWIRDEMFVSGSGDMVCVCATTQEHQ
jgi:hypothetical protein